MGILYRLLVPKAIRRPARIVRHPVNSAWRAVAPRPIKRARRAAFGVMNPVQFTESVVEDAVVRALRGSGRRRSGTPGMRITLEPQRGVSNGGVVLEDVTG